MSYYPPEEERIQLFIAIFSIVALAGALAVAFLT